MSMSSNHTKAFVQCCHGKHTVVSLGTLLSDHEYNSRKPKEMDLFENLGTDGEDNITTDPK